MRLRIAIGSLVVATAALGWAFPAGALHEASNVSTATVAAGKPTEFRFKLSKLRLPKGVVAFKVTNLGTIPHDFKVNGKKTRSLLAGKSQTIKVTFLKAGKYRFICTLPSHAAAGMKGVLTIT